MKAWYKNLIAAAMLIFSTLCFAVDDALYAFNSNAEAQRFQQLTKEIRCVVCQNQNIADSNAPLAGDLRHKVYEMVKAKKTNAEIKNYLVKRYGEFILFMPRFNAVTALLWLFPAIALVFVFGVIALACHSRALLLCHSCESRNL